MEKIKSKNNKVWDMYSIDLETTTIYNIFTKAWNYRWWKIYSNDKKVIFLSGLVEVISFIWWQDIKEIYETWDIIEMKANIPHIFYFKEDSEIIEYFSKNTQTEKYDRYYNMK